MHTGPDLPCPALTHALPSTSIRRCCAHGTQKAYIRYRWCVVGSQRGVESPVAAIWAAASRAATECHATFAKWQVLCMACRMPDRQGALQASPQGRTHTRARTHTHTHTRARTQAHTRPYTPTHTAGRIRNSRAAAGEHAIGTPSLAAPSQPASQPPGSKQPATRSTI